MLGLEMASVEEFVQSPTETLLKCYKKEQLLEVARYYQLEVPEKVRKDVLLNMLKTALRDKKILPVLAESETVITSGDLPSRAKLVSPLLSSFGDGLTFEEQKELLLLQYEQEQKHTLELEKL